MRKSLILGIALLVTSVVVLGGTVFRQQVADAASVLNVFVTNNSSHPVPVREQNLDAQGNIKVHEQGTANVNVTNSSLSVAQPAPVTAGGTSVGFASSSTISQSGTATALSIHFTPATGSTIALKLDFQGNTVAVFDGPPTGNDSIVLALSRPIRWDQMECLGAAPPNNGECDVSWVGNEP
jgi:hypothetical protein